MGVRRTIYQSIKNSNGIRIAILLLIAIYIFVNIFSIGGVSFIIGLNNYTSNLLALGVTTLAIIVWRQMARDQNRSLWTGFAIGWALWTIAEIWWAVASIRGNEIPYPSLADFFWLVGYIPMYIALWFRIHSLPKTHHRLRNIIIWSVSTIIVASTIIFILVPIFRNYDSTLLLVSILNILYPIVDLVLLILGLWILFAYEQGSYGRVWIWLSIGFLLHSLSNLFFSYASSVNLYYPQGNTNLISTLAIDIPYTLSYLAWIIGMMIFMSLQKRHQQNIRLESSLPIIPNTHVLIFTKGDDTVTTVSENYQRVFPSDKLKVKVLTEAIGITDEEARSIFKEIRMTDGIRDRLLSVKTIIGNQNALFSGLPIAHFQGNYEGAIFLIRLMMADNSLDKLLTEYQTEIVMNVIKKVGAIQAGDKEKNQFLSGYYSTYIKTLYNRIFVEGGITMADALDVELRSVCDKNGWHMAFHPDYQLDTNNMTLVETEKALQILLETAKRYAANIMGADQVDIAFQEVNTWFDDSVHKNVSNLFEGSTVFSQL